MEIEARRTDQLCAEMRRKGITYLLYQHYRMPDRTDPRYPLFVQRNRPELLDHFREGLPVPGFSHVATLQVPEQARSSDVQIYRAGPRCAEKPDD
jgi:hypothetical protein